MFMLRKLMVIASVAALALEASAAKPRDIKNLRKEKQATERVISETSKKLKAKNLETRKTLGELSKINGEIARKSTEISAVTVQVDSLNRSIKSAADTLDRLSQRRDRLKQSYINALRDMQGSGESLSFVGFVFSSSSFREAMARMRYVGEYGRWHNRRQQELRDLSDEITRRKADLSTTYTQRERSLAQLNQSRRSLEVRKTDADKLVAKLKKEQSSLRSVLKENERRMRRLDNELDRLIAEEQRRREREAAEKEAAKGGKGGAPSKSKGKSASPTPSAKVLIAEADRKMNGSFESNRGRLLFPVKGSYTIVKGFGRNKHTQLEHVETINNGIDIGVSPGTSARCIFDGVVSAIFRQEGFGNIVMVRHGSYLSVYANLSSISVRQGQKLSANEQIGSIGKDENGRNVMHFELRRERSKLNPLEWVK